ncbi:MAG: NAD kinase [Neolewinella sp.]|jgi:NAD kinase|nr:hypothetical protein [Lewinella sp.]
MKYLSLLLLATVMMFSCGDAATTTEETTAEETTEVAAPEVSAEVPAEVPAEVSSSILTATIDAVTSVGGDLTALPAAAAVSNIESWITKLGTMEGTEGMVADLTSLKTELAAAEIDGGKVSTLLTSLASQTKSMADTAPGLGALAGALQAGADKLGGK